MQRTNNKSNYSKIMLWLFVNIQYKSSHQWKVPSYLAKHLSSSALISFYFSNFFTTSPTWGSSSSSDFSMKIPLKSHSSNINFKVLVFNYSLAFAIQSDFVALAVSTLIEKSWNSLFWSRKFLTFSAEASERGLLSFTFCKIYLSLLTNYDREVKTDWGISA